MVKKKGDVMITGVTHQFRGEKKNYGTWRKSTLDSEKYNYERDINNLSETPLKAS